LRRADYVAELTRAVNAGEFLGDRTEIIATEIDFLIDLHGHSIGGRIDRVDRSPDGISAVDYKSSSVKPPPVSDREGRKLDLQIAVYLAALREMYPLENIASGTYYSLSARKHFKADIPPDELLSEFINNVVSAPLTGGLHVRPISSETCAFCDYDRVCRNGSRIVRKEAAAK
jgi:hypothetical protein